MKHEEEEEAEDVVSISGSIALEVGRHVDPSCTVRANCAPVIVQFLGPVRLPVQADWGRRFDRRDGAPSRRVARRTQ